MHREKLPKTAESPRLRAPFVYPGGKSMVASVVWEHFGTSIETYVEPFFGTGAVLLGRPNVRGKEIINDLDDMICNFWRAIRKDPEGVAQYTDWPAIESDKHARHHWLLDQRHRGKTLRKRLEGDPDYCEIKTAGYWIWVMSLWMGTGVCAGDGPWIVKKKDGYNQLVFERKAGTGVSRQLPMLGSRAIMSRTALIDIKAPAKVRSWFVGLSKRLADVTIACGDWTRVCGGASGESLSSILPANGGVCGIFLDPPYSADANYKPVYTNNDLGLANDVREWAREHGKSKRFWIALCGYEGEHNSLLDSGWTVQEWKSQGGWSGLANVETQAQKNRFRERIWFSPHCGDKCEWKYEPSK